MRRFTAADRAAILHGASVIVPAELTDDDLAWVDRELQRVERTAVRAGSSGDRSWLTTESIR